MSVGEAGFTKGAAGGRLHSIVRGWSGGVSVATQREVAGGGAAGGGLHRTERGWGGGVSVAAPC